MDPGDATLRRRRRCRLPLPPLSPTAATSAAAVGRSRCRSLPPPVTSAAAVNCRLRQTPRLPPSAAPATARHGRPGPPAATLVSGGGSGDRGNPGRARRNPRGSLPNHPQGRGGPHAGEALRLWDPLLTGADGVGGGPGPRPGAADGDWGRPGQKGASHALAIIRPGQCLLNPTTSVCLPGQSTRRGPPLGGGYP